MAVVEIAKNRRSQGGGSSLLKAVTGATKNASLEARWLAERLSFGDGIVSGQGRRIITFSYDCPGQGGAHSVGIGGGDKKGIWHK